MSHPHQHDPPSRQNSDNVSQSQPVVARSVGALQRLRNDESWVEISSQPSSSSLSSIGDEIVTTGLRVQQDHTTRRRRRVPAGLPSHIAIENRQTSTSSQEEYEESESEDDQVMSSSNEHVIPSTRLPPPARAEYDGGSDSDDDDENATALGRRTDAREVFTPQPNAFSHPPSSHRPSVPGSYFPGSSQPAPNTRPSYTNRSTSRTQPSSYNQADHDAALRASLTTLLSIGAAAARGLPKRNQSNIGGTQTIPSNEPMDLRFVPESELVAVNASRPLSPSPRARSSPSISSQEAVMIDKHGKRKAGMPAGAGVAKGEKARLEKKRRKGSAAQQLSEETMISPTLLTWVMSAGVVVLVSVVGFGAGYVIGREVGRQEGIAVFNGSLVGDGASCGREVVRGSGSGSGTLRRFKWGLTGGGAKSIVA